MVGGHTRNKALKNLEMVFTEIFKENTGSDKQKTRINWNSMMRLVATKGKKQPMFKNKLKKQHEKKGGEAISSILAQSETVCENNSQWKNTEQKKLEGRMLLLTKEISN